MTFLMVCLFATLTRAEDQFDTRDMAYHANRGGYNSYHDNFRDPDATLPRNDYAPKLITDRSLLSRDVLVKERDGVEDSRVDRRMVVEMPTKLEEFYRTRSDDLKLNQYGYNLLEYIDLKSKNDDKNAPPMGVVQDDYILQVGDEVSVTFTGERKGRVVYKIDSGGRLLIENMPPFQATGKTLGALKLDVETFLVEMGYQGQTLISVEGMRQIGVLVAGHVRRPGRHNMNAFHSVIDAIQMAGGITKSGSLRQIHLVRAGQTTAIDLYGFLNDGQLPDRLQLADGDRIIVPPIGPTIAVVGDVKQAGIFELKPDPRMAWRKAGGNTAHRVTLSDALRLAGGVLGAGDNHFTVRQSDSSILNITNQNQPVIGDSSIVTVTRVKDVAGNAVTLAGYSRKNGLYDLKTTPTLLTLLGDRQAFGDDIYPLIGVISRMNRQSLTRSMMGFSPQSIALATDDRALQSGDIVYLFSHDDITAIKAEAESEDDENDANDKSDFPKLVRDFVRDHTVTIQGAVRDAGAWPVGQKADLRTLISVAGGLTATADINNIEVVSENANGMGRQRQTLNDTDAPLESLLVNVGDQIRINEKFTKTLAQSVKVTGEVKNPGTYDLMRGDTLSMILTRSGGLTDQAYAPAAVLSRENERKREEQKFRAAAQQLEQTVSVNLNATDKDAALTPAQISMARDLANDLRTIKAVGRVTVEADPAVLIARPELDVLMEGGDHLHIPKRHLTVRVSGEVMNAAALLFEDGKDAQDYIREAGGMTYYADTSRIFVLYPDGSSVPLSGSSWRNSKPAMVIPGSTIIVPRDPKPFNFVDSFKDITQILTNMAITTVFIDDVVSD